MKKLLFMLVVPLFILAGCTANSETSGAATDLELWTFQAAHEEFYNKMAESWNKENPDEQINLSVSVLPYEDLHNKLLVCASSGKGCPDIADIEVKRFPLFLEGGEVPFYDMTSYVTDSSDEFVTSRLELYGKDDKYYGLPFHIGADVMYYNEDILAEAGVSSSTIKTWDDYIKAGYTVTEKTGVPMTVVESSENLLIWAMLVQYGADITNADGTANINAPGAIQVYEQVQQMIKDGVVKVAPGGFVHSEDFYGFMNNSGAASIPMPLWYLNRFTDYMPDLNGKVSVAPLPINPDNPEVSTVGIGGTGTVVMNVSENAETAANYLANAKLSQEGNILMWDMLGFDPVNVSVWDQLKTPEKFSTYFKNDPLEVLQSYDPKEIESTISQPITVDVINELSTNTYFQMFEESKSVKETVDQSQSNVK